MAARGGKVSGRVLSRGGVGRRGSSAGMTTKGTGRTGRGDAADTPAQSAARRPLRSSQLRSQAAASGSAACAAASGTGPPPPRMRAKPRLASETWRPCARLAAQAGLHAKTPILPPRMTWPVLARRRTNTSPLVIAVTRQAWPRASVVVQPATLQRRMPQSWWCRRVPASLQGGRRHGAEQGELRPGEGISNAAAECAAGMEAAGRSTAATRPTAGSAAGRPMRERLCLPLNPSALAWLRLHRMDSVCVRVGLRVHAAADVLDLVAPALRRRAHSRAAGYTSGAAGGGAAACARGASGAAAPSPGAGRRRAGAAPCCGVGSCGGAPCGAATCAVRAPRFGGRAAAGGFCWPSSNAAAARKGCCALAGAPPGGAAGSPGRGGVTRSITPGLISGLCRSITSSSIVARPCDCSRAVHKGGRAGVRSGEAAGGRQTGRSCIGAVGGLRGAHGTLRSPAQAHHSPPQVSQSSQSRHPDAHLRDSPVPLEVRGGVTG